MGYPSSLQPDVMAAWLDGVATWRAKKAADERNLEALRLYLETGSMEEVRKMGHGVSASPGSDASAGAEESEAALPAQLDDAPSLVNATLQQFEIGPEMGAAKVRAELLQELDMDVDDVADGALPQLESGTAIHLAHRNLSQV